MKIIFVRHAASTKNLNNRHGATREQFYLTDQGIRDTRSFADTLKGNVEIDCVCTSMANPCTETARYIANSTNSYLVSIKELDSIDFGIVSGLPEEQMRKEYPYYYKQMWDYHDRLLHPKDYEIPGSETNSEFELRIRAGLIRILSSRCNTVCVVAHRSTISMALNIILNWPNTTDSGAYSVFSLEPLSVSLVEIMDASLKGIVTMVGQDLKSANLSEICKTEKIKSKQIDKSPRITSHIVLGVNYGTHDTSAALIINGKIVCAIEEEKFNRTKRTSEFPSNAINYCLSVAGILPDEIDYIALPICLSDYIDSLKRKIQPPNSINVSEDSLAQISSTLFQLSHSNLVARLNLQKQNTDISYFNHHKCHAANAFYLSGWRSAAVLVIDGVGESDTISIYDASCGKLTKLAGEKFPNSLGKLYGAVCRYLGFTGSNKEGKVMSLAALGKPIYLNFFESLLNWKHGLPVIDESFFEMGYTCHGPSMVSRKFVEAIGVSSRKDSLLDEGYNNIACSLQNFLEKTVVKIAFYTKQITGHEFLCFGGGVSLNCKLNNEIRHAKIFTDVYIPPAPHDSGLALGAALLKSNSICCLEQDRLSEIYLGPSYSADCISTAIKKSSLNSIPLDSPSKFAARMIADGKIIGWFQGKLEYGPRALGNRSILGDPRESLIKEKLNRIIKQREQFMPFAPSILDEYQNEVLVSSSDSCFMQEVFLMRDEWADKVPAVIHSDKTVRAQIVHKGLNVKYWRLINEFFKLTGIPMVLNTSMNGANEPIVNSPEQAINLFVQSDIDVLVLGDVAIVKDKITAAL